MRAALPSFTPAAAPQPAAAAAAAAAGVRCLSSAADSIPAEETPNPNALKFRPLLSRPLVNKKGKVTSTQFYRGSSNTSDSPMAQALLQVEGVSSVLIGAGFVSVVKTAEADWASLKPLVEEAIRSSVDAQLAAAAAAAAAEESEEAAAAGAAAAAAAEAKAAAANAPLSEEEAELFESIKETINHRVKPMLQSDGGDVEVLRFDAESGALYVHLLGSCQGCPSSTVTVKRGMEQMLKYYYPEVEEVIECDENGDPIEPSEDE
ncbi:NifU-like domain-containing protein, putative [Eimeria tenella]|uniref:NifU-like domain-containing protein, putative n=1 Tax=Eimeria tenella TaxID=5802 RepID=U6KKF6_EIMTE|nr:NifU-like domain-containing protein, putative [Eimeria tenella]CDJ37306.1 NifU-like domain-containing protein, putative [Eimeria tenella]|eukprot:XP_013228144.1 NifU-like domain-containing protein, putative [Eimeria tenella]